MQIVIEMDDKRYKELLNPYQYNEALCDKLKTIIRKGTPLPKGHGRLIDADAFISLLKDASKRHKYKELFINDYLTVDDVFKAIIESLQNEGLAKGDTPTIIEAESEVKND